MTATKETFQSNSPEQTFEIGTQIGRRLGQGDCVALIGDLGAGKTAITRGISQGLGIEDLHLVSSPTYVLVQEYPARVTVFHLDLYRMSDPGPELSDLGLQEMLDEGVVLVEWADKALDHLPASRYELRIEITGSDSRTISLEKA